MKTGGKRQIDILDALARAAIVDASGIGVTEDGVVTLKGSADQLERRLQEKLRNIAEIDAEEVAITEREGRVTLRGTARSLDERSAAERAALATPGVAAVENELDVRFQPRV